MKPFLEKTPEQIKSVNFRTYTQQILEILEVTVQDEMMLNDFLRELEVMETSEAAVVIGFTSQNAKAIAEKDYKYELERAVEDVFQKNLAVKCVLKRGQGFFQTNTASPIISKNLVKRFTFENYVTSDFNKEAVQIGKGILNNIGRNSPFFITSKSGLGKTHLIHAIGNELAKNNRSVIYIDPNNFTREISELAKNGKSISEYTDGLKEFETLIFDDIQNLTDRSVTLNVLFELINHHIENNKQIIIASDKLVKELSGFESRFITRFSSGITTIIKEPTVDELVKILEAKLEWTGMDIKNWEKESLYFIARNNSTSIRSIEGAIKRVVFFTGSESNIQYTAKVVANIFKELAVDPVELTPQRVLQVVSAYYKIPVKDIIGKSRKQEMVVPRHMAIYLIKKIVLGISLVEIGRIFGNRDHTTILASLRKIDTDINMNKATKLAVDKIEQNVKSVS